MKKHKRIILLTSSAMFILSGCKAKDMAINSKPNDIVIQKDTDNLENSDITETEQELINNVDDLIENNNSCINEPINEIVEEPVDEEFKIPDEYEQCDDYIYVSEDVNLMADTYNESDLGILIDSYNKVYRIATDENWDIVEYNDEIGYIKSEHTEVIPESYVEVDIEDQTVYLYKDSELLLTSDIVTGKSTSSPTRIGFFNIKKKSADTYLKGPGYKTHVDYWMPFDGGIGLHDASWRDEFGGDIYLKEGSHGCVNLPIETADTIYNNVEVGTNVLVHK